MPYPTNNRQNYRMRPNSAPPPTKNPYLSRQELKKKALEYSSGQQTTQDNTPNSMNSKMQTSTTQRMAPQNMLQNANGTNSIELPPFLDESVDVNNGRLTPATDNTMTPQMNNQNRTITTPMDNDWATKATRSWMDYLEATPFSTKSQKPSEKSTSGSKPYDTNRDFPWMNPRGDERLSPSTSRDLVNRPQWLMNDNAKNNGIRTPNRDMGMSDNDMSMPDNDMNMNDNDMNMPNNDMNMNDNSMSMPNNNMAMPNNNMAMPDNDMSMPDNNMNMDDMRIPINNTPMPRNNTPTSRNNTPMPRSNMNMPNNNMAMPMNNREMRGNGNSNAHNDMDGYDMFDFLPRTESENKEYLDMIRRHPEDVRRIHAEVEKAFDRLSYKGSWIYDKNPDRATLLRLSEDIYRSLLPITVGYNPDTDNSDNVEEENRTPGLLPNKLSPRWMLYVIYLLVQTELIHRQS